MKKFYWKQIGETNKGLPVFLNTGTKEIQVRENARGRPPTEEEKEEIADLILGLLFASEIPPFYFFN